VQPDVGRTVAEPQPNLCRMSEHGKNRRFWPLNGEM